MSRKIIAILRGITPAEVTGVGAALVAAGITSIEVPLNSPDALRSIDTLVTALSDSARIGAGTVLSAQDVAAVHDVGGTFVVSPDCNPTVIETTKSRGMASYPGVATPTECFTALRHGADGLKVFPAFLIGVKGLAAICAVLPTDTQTYAVGGVGPEDFQAWLDAGATGFGIGSGLYQPGRSLREVQDRARTVVAAYDAALAP